MGLSYTSIRVKDVKKSTEFYTKRLGLKLIGRRSPIPGEEIVSLEDKSTKQRINLMWYSKSCAIYTPWKEDGVELDHLMFEVDDAKKAYNKMVKAGAPVAMKLREFDSKGKCIAMGFVKDPNGIWIGLRSESRDK
jgi:catechol 2,3-dioxygenase-like lactoylglutathione lyase family enzyme